MTGTTAQQYELLFASLRDQRREVAFPCDAQGRVDMDALTFRALNDYLFARAFIGRDFSMPSVRRVQSRGAGGAETRDAREARGRDARDARDAREAWPLPGDAVFA